MPTSNCNIACIPGSPVLKPPLQTHMEGFLLPWQSLPNLFYFLLGPLRLVEGREPGWLGFRLTKRNTFIVNINGKPRSLQGLGLAA